MRKPSESLPKLLLRPRKRLVELGLTLSPQCDLKAHTLTIVVSLALSLGIDFFCIAQCQMILINMTTSHLLSDLLLVFCVFALNCPPKTHTHTQC
jgi:hypothetical protein